MCHTRGAFHPAAALLRLVSDEPANPETEERGAACSTAEETEARGATCTGAGKKRRRERAAASAHPVFSFTTGVGELRYAARNRGIDAVLGGLPAYNRALNAYAHPSLRPLAHAPSLPDSYAGNVPFDFPRLASLTQPATLCFTWHFVERRWWPRALPAATLGELCAEALRRGELEPLRSVVDLQRVVDDPSLSDHARRSAPPTSATTRSACARRGRRRRTGGPACVRGGCGGGP